MTVNILGISAFYHDSAACLVQNGRIIAAAQEERFTRIKHDSSMPESAVDYCLSEAGISINELDNLVFYELPDLRFERIVSSFFKYAPRGYGVFKNVIPLWMKDKLWVENKLKSTLGFKGDVMFAEHHLSHAASAFYPSPFTRAAILTLDGVGEWSTTTYGMGIDNQIQIHKEIRYPDSLGLLYTAFTYFLGFKVNSGEYKVMGLAPYGEPIYKEKILDNIVTVFEDGSFKLNLEYFNYHKGLTMTSKRFEYLFKMKKRVPEDKLEQCHMDMAASIQAVTNSIIINIAKHIKQETGADNLCMAGGVALNCVANGIIQREKIFDDIWIQPAAGDAGGALGAAFQAWFGELGNKRTVENSFDHMHNALLGPSYSDSYVKQFINSYRIPAKYYEDDKKFKTAAKLISEGNVLGWFQDRMEFGPRALGNRSILGDARSEKMQTLINLKIKFRESFRPFAPSVLEDNISEYFEIDTPSPYMLLVAPVANSFKDLATDNNNEKRGLERLKIKRSNIPAVTHVDYSARIQSVSKEGNPQYYKLINEFKKITDCSVIINTSFNVRGEPIVRSPKDAYRCFMRTNMDYLFLGSYLLNKNEQLPLYNEADWTEEFTLD